MAKKGKESGVDKALSSARSAIKSVAGRVPFLKRPPQPASPEPFSAIEDETPVGDILSEANAAPGVARPAKAKPSIDLGAVAEAATKNPIVLAAGIIILLFLVAIAVTTIIVNAPPKPIRASSAPTAEGTALVKTWLLPPGDPLAARAEFEREGKSSYVAADAAGLALARAGEYAAALAARNDAGADELFGTVR
jgi:hypothetical protein